MHQYQERVRLKISWKDSYKRDKESIGLKEEDVLDRDMESVGLKEDDPLDRKKWTNDIHDHCDDPR